MYRWTYERFENVVSTLSTSCYTHGAPALAWSFLTDSLWLQNLASANVDVVKEMSATLRTFFNAN